MLLEINLLKYFLTYENYKIYIKYLDLNKTKENYKEVFNLYITLEEYFEKYSKDLSLEELEIFFYSQRPALRDKEREVYKVLFEQIRNSEVSEKLITDILIEIKQRQEAFDLSSLAYEVSQGKRNFIDLITEAHNLEHEEKLDEVDQSVFTTDDLEQLYKGSVEQQGLRWRLDTLNKMFGSLRRGDFGFIFSRPESGKTTFLASEVSYFAEQTVASILWFNNEQAGEAVMLRIYQATLGLTLEELFSNLEEHKKKYFELTKGNIKLYDQGNISRTDVERLVYQLRPGCIIFDQIDKIKGFVNDREDLRLGAIYQWARELAKEYCPVIGVCQADGTGEGQKWLTMANVANAKTSKQAEADWILGMGKSNNEGEEFVRYFYASKNKLVGDKDTNPAMRHGQAIVIIDPPRARFKDI